LKVCPLFSRLACVRHAADGLLSQPCGRTLPGEPIVRVHRVFDVSVPLAVLNDINSLEVQAHLATSKMGPSAGSYYGDAIKPKLDRKMQKITREARAGRAQFSMSAAQFHGGGEIGGFRDFATSADEGFIHAKRGEVVMHQQAAQTNAPMLQAMTGGLNYRDMMPSKMQPVQQRDVNLHFHSADAKAARQLFMDNKHHLRAALNDSYSEYSGGADA
jgi:hypothetical protein